MGSNVGLSVKRTRAERQIFMRKNIFPGESSLTRPEPEDCATLSTTEPPRLIVGIDTEAEFDWGRTFSRTKGKIRSIAEQYRAQEVFEKYGVVPTYLVDFAVADDDDAVRILSELRDAGQCEIGAHLNPWLNPPFDEPLDRFHSYPCNLPAQLERQKLERLTSRILEQFGESPRVYIRTMQFTQSFNINGYSGSPKLLALRLGPL